VDTSGNAWNYTDGYGAGEFTGLPSVKQVVNAQGANYLLLTNGQLLANKYVEPLGKWIWSLKASNVASISGGTDKMGVSCVDYVTNSGAAYEYSESTGVHLIRASGVAAISAGQFGEAGLLLTTGEADVWLESSNKATVMASSGVAQITIGTTPGGGILVERLDTNGNLWEYQNGYTNPPTQIQSGVASISSARLGIVDAIMSNGTAQEHNDTTKTWITIDSNTVTGVG
jgi:hypothetical protein